MDDQALDPNGVTLPQMIAELIVHHYPCLLDDCFCAEIAAMPEIADALEIREAMRAPGGCGHA